MGRGRNEGNCFRFRPSIVPETALPFPPIAIPKPSAAPSSVLTLNLLPPHVGRRLLPPKTPSSSTGDEDPSDLLGYFHKVRLCNRGKALGVPALRRRSRNRRLHSRRMITGSFAEHLRKFGDVFLFHLDSPRAGRFGVEFYDDRTDALACVVKSLESGLIPDVSHESIFLWSGAVVT